MRYLFVLWHKHRCQLTVDNHRFSLSLRSHSAWPPTTDGALEDRRQYGRHPWNLISHPKCHWIILQDEVDNSEERELIIESRSCKFGILGEEHFSPLTAKSLKPAFTSPAAALRSQSDLRCRLTKAHLHFEASPKKHQSSNPRTAS